MKITFLGTGTSHGVPVINCDCTVCSSKNPKNRRLRSSVLIETKNVNILIDTSPDFRQQFLSKKVERIDAVLYTHEHADHVFGLDDLRRFCWIQKERIPLFGKQDFIEHITKIFTYAFGEGEFRYGIPNLQANIVSENFNFADQEIIPIELYHNKKIIFGYRINNFAYCTDVSKIPQQSYAKLENLDILVLDALREKPHPSHFSLKRAIREAQKIKAKQTYFTHMNHMLDHDNHGKSLPESMQFAHDGLELEI